MDPEAATARAFGILNEEDGGIPHPTSIVIDRAGVVRIGPAVTRLSRRPIPDKMPACLSMEGVHATPRHAAPL